MQPQWPRRLEVTTFAAHLPPPSFVLSLVVLNDLAGSIPPDAMSPFAATFICEQSDWLQ
jgi:hypothetical protein